jgi:hypothetical protein
MLLSSPLPYPNSNQPKLPKFYPAAAHRDGSRCPGGLRGALGHGLFRRAGAHSNLHPAQLRGDLHRLARGFR